MMNATIDIRRPREPESGRGCSRGQPSRGPGAPSAPSLVSTMVHVRLRRNHRCTLLRPAGLDAQPHPAERLLSGAGCRCRYGPGIRGGARGQVGRPPVHVEKLVNRRLATSLADSRRRRSGDARGGRVPQQVLAGRSARPDGDVRLAWASPPRRRGRHGPVLRADPRHQPRPPSLLPVDPSTVHQGPAGQNRQRTRVRPCRPAGSQLRQ